ncbi:MAG: phytanoyl-CoA dioxygenase family protein [Planctomycetes bacterium]|nr:phytanoyl-CoA dioxygenase family protein [Planctomycetota bacterium]
MNTAACKALPKVTQEMIDQYVNDGYLIVEGLFDEDDLEAMKAEAPKIARGGRNGFGPMLENVEEKTDAELEKEIYCIHGPHGASDVVMDYMKDERVAAVLAKITGAHLPKSHWDGSVKCMQAMYFCKAPGMPGQAWHQDELYIPTRDRSLLGAWYALDGANEENGCLYVVPGSHRRGHLYPQRAHNDDEFDGGPQSYGFDYAQEVPVVVNKGAVVFFNGYLLHRSSKNRSENDFRRVLVNHYMTAESLLPWGAAVEGGAIGTYDKRPICFVSGTDPKPDEALQEQCHMTLRSQNADEEWSSVYKEGHDPADKA